MRYYSEYRFPLVREVRLAEQKRTNWDFTSPLYGVDSRHTNRTPQAERGVSGANCGGDVNSGWECKLRGRRESSRDFLRSECARDRSSTGAFCEKGSYARLLLRTEFISVKLSWRKMRNSIKIRSTPHGKSRVIRQAKDWSIKDGYPQTIKSSFERNRLILLVILVFLL